MIKFISILPIAIYLLFIYYKYGIQKSISESYYRLTNKQKPLFYLALVATSVLFIIGYAIENNNPLQVTLLFLAGSAICFTGAAAEFKGTKLTEIVHTVGASTGYVLGYIFLIAVHGFNSVWFIVPSLISIYMLKKYIKHKRYLHESNDYTSYYENTFVWWAEIIGLITIYLGIIIKLTI